MAGDTERLGGLGNILQQLTRSAENSWQSLLQRWEVRLPRVTSVVPHRPMAAYSHNLAPIANFASVTTTADLSWSQLGTASLKPYNPPNAVTKEELGRATWTLLHTLAAQLPDTPTRQQQKDVRTLIDCLTRIYPCGDCAGHFGELVRDEPPVVTSGLEFQRWLCRTHNRVNHRLGRPEFNCDYVQSRWQPLDCGEEHSCSLTTRK